MITAKERKKSVRAINEYGRARVAESWGGERHPEDIPLLEQDLAKAVTELNEILDELTHKGN